MRALTTTKKGWLLVFIPPELGELAKDYVFSKGSQRVQGHINTPERLGIVAIEEFLSARGYKIQVEELRKARFERRPVKEINLDYLDETQRRAVLSLMEHRHLNESHAIRWVLEHSKEIDAIWR